MTKKWHPSSDFGLDSYRHVATKCTTTEARSDQMMALMTVL